MNPAVVIAERADGRRSMCCHVQAARFSRLFVARVQRKFGTSILLITHDLGSSPRAVSRV